MSKVTIALDAMGGDHGHAVVIPAALNALRRYDDLAIILVGQESVIEPKVNGQFPDRLFIKHASEVVEMDDPPSTALRTKKDSSMRVAINLIKEEVADACVSAGNTGALMVTARFVLKTLPGIDRPAILSALPTKKGKVNILDLGANVDSCAEYLVQFAIMGSILTEAVDGIKKPRVGVLNIGTEEIKGNDQVKQCAHMLSQLPEINYIGYVEGDKMFEDVADLIVCDGFVGNIALKTTEGVARMVSYYLRRAFQKNALTKLAGMFALPVLRRLKKTLDPSQYNGASFVGLSGIVVKSHGSANVLAFEQAIRQAMLAVENNVPNLINEQVATLLMPGAY